MKNIHSKFIVILLILIFLLSTNISFAGTKQQLEQQLENQKNQQNQMENKIDDAEKKHKELESQKSETLKQVQNLGSQINNYESQISELDSKIEDANSKIADAEKKLAEEQKKYDHQEEMLQKRIVAMYEAGETKYIDVLLSSETITDFISYYYIVSEIAQCDLDLLQSIQKQKEEIEVAKKQIESSKQELITAKAEKQSIATELKTAKDEKNKQAENLTEQEKELEKELDELKKANDKILSEIRIAEQQYKEQLQKLKDLENQNKNNNNSNSSNNSSSGSGIFSRPVKTGSITAQAYYSSGKFHGAIDYGVPVGTPVYAAATGVVILTENLTKSYGTHVIIRHANGLQTYYAHGTRGSIMVSSGQIVQKGQQIMLSGNTGNSEGPHLHFEVRKPNYGYDQYAKAYGQDSRVNPLAYM